MIEVEIDRSATIKWPDLTRVGEGLFERSSEATDTGVKNPLISIVV
jgi:hypothetical protein